MAVRVNSIQSPREEMAELKGYIEHEKEFRRSCRVSASPEYYASQKAYLEEQIAFFQSKLETLTVAYTESESRISESFDRQKKYETRYKLLKHRDKIAKMEELQKQIEQLKAEME